MVQHDAAVAVNVQQGTGLVVEGCSKRDPIFDGSERNTAFEYFAVVVERPDLPASVPVTGFFLQFIHQFMDDVILHSHAVWRHVPVIFSVEIDFPYVKRVFIEMAGNLVHDVFYSHHPLGSAETPEGYV